VLNEERSNRHRWICESHEHVDSGDILSLAVVAVDFGPVMLEREFDLNLTIVGVCLKINLVNINYKLWIWSSIPGVSNEIIRSGFFIVLLIKNYFFHNFFTDFHKTT
jgi:hypothetical protein